MHIQRIHHVAYRCRNAREMVEFYQRMMEMDFQLAIAEDKVPLTQAPDPYRPVFLDAGRGNVLAFFEVPNSPPMQKAPNTPDWVQHIAFEVEDMAAAMKRASLKNGRDGNWMVVTGNLQNHLPVANIAPALQYDALDHWAETEPALRQSCRRP